MHWLLTRPTGFNHELESALEKLGQRSSTMPALSIEPFSMLADEAVWSQLSCFDTLLFTSINAVRHFQKQLTTRLINWPLANYLAIGRGTADALAAKGIAAIFPEGDSTSESLLAMDVVARLAHKRLLLVTGVGGRGVLQPALEQRQVSVQRLTVYRRCCNLDTTWPDDNIDGLLVTSLDSWHCLLKRGLLREPVLTGCLVVAGGARIATETAKYLPTKTALSPRNEHLLSVIRKECQ